MWGKNLPFPGRCPCYGRNTAQWGGLAGQRRWFAEPFPPVRIMGVLRQRDQRFDPGLVAGDDLRRAAQAVIGEQVVGGVEAVRQGPNSGKHRLELFLGRWGLG